MTDTDSRCFARNTLRTASGSAGSGVSTTSVDVGGGSIGRSSATSRIVVGSEVRRGLSIAWQPERGVLATGRQVALHEHRIIGPAAKISAQGLAIVLLHLSLIHISEPTRLLSIS